MRTTGDPVHPQLVRPVGVHPDLAHAAAFAARSGTNHLWGLVADARGHRSVSGTDVALPEDLVGFDAPPEWEGLVFASTGTMRRVESDGGPQRIRLGYALNRSGASASSIATLDGRHLLTPTKPPSGHVPDVCRRVLGMSTEAELRSPAPLLVEGWLQEIIDLASDPTMAGWADDWLAVADLHPAADLCTGRSPEELRSALLDAPEAHRTWQALYDSAVALGTPVAGFEPWEVEWLDASSLARFLLAAAPPVEGLLARVLDVVPQHVGREIARCTLGDVPVDIS